MLQAIILLQRFFFFFFYSILYYLTRKEAVKDRTHSEFNNMILILVTTRLSSTIAVWPSTH